MASPRSKAALAWSTGTRGTCASFSGKFAGGCVETGSVISVGLRFSVGARVGAVVGSVCGSAALHASDARRSRQIARRTGFVLIIAYYFSLVITVRRNGQYASR